MWPEDGDMQGDEMERALKENRQPMCVYCNKLLDKICQTQYDRITWEWKPELKKYVKLEPDGDSDAHMRMFIVTMYQFQIENMLHYFPSMDRFLTSP